MKYPGINIQIRYPNTLINADTPSGTVTLRYNGPESKGNLLTTEVNY